MPSASDWRSPKGPARLGPIRFCMSATTLRSSQMVMSTVTSRRAKTNSVLPMTMSTTVRSTPLAKSGSPIAVSGGHGLLPGGHRDGRHRSGVDQHRGQPRREPDDPGGDGRVGGGGDV